MQQLSLFASLKYLYYQMPPRIERVNGNLQGSFSEFQGTLCIHKAAAAGARRRIT